MWGRLDNPRFIRVSGQQRTTRNASRYRAPAERSQFCPPTQRPTGTSSPPHTGITIDAEYHLAAAGWKVFAPLHLQRGLRKAERIVPLFGNYLFVGWSHDADWGSLQRVRYVWSLLMAEPGRPAVVPDGVVEDLQRRSSPRRVVDDPLLTAAAYLPGEPIKIRAGPLAGLQGVCGLSAGARVRVLFELFGKEMQADFRNIDVMAVG
jgi:transcription antitermination factor NusG